MSPKLRMTFGRQIERILVVIAGGMAIYLGFRLFYLAKQKQGDLRVQGKDFHLSLSDVAPGIYFALFGSAILIINLFSTVEQSITQDNQQLGVSSNSSPTKLFYRGISGGGNSLQQDDNIFANREFRDPKMAEGNGLILTLLNEVQQSVHNGSASQFWKPTAVDEIRISLRPYMISTNFARVLDECKTEEDLWAFLQSYQPYFYLTETKPQ